MPVSLGPWPIQHLTLSQELSYISKTKPSRNDWCFFLVQKGISCVFFCTSFHEAEAPLACHFGILCYSARALSTKKTWYLWVVFGSARDITAVRQLQCRLFRSATFLFILTSRPNGVTERTHGEISKKKSPNPSGFLFPPFFSFLFISLFCISSSCWLHTFVCGFMPYWFLNNDVLKKELFIPFFQ